jgi:hypothetical protein
MSDLSDEGRPAVPCCALDLYRVRYCKGHFASVRFAHGLTRIAHLFLRQSVSSLASLAGRSMYCTLGPILCLNPRHPSLTPVHLSLWRYETSSYQVNATTLYPTFSLTTCAATKWFDTHRPLPLKEYQHRSLMSCHSSSPYPTYALLAIYRTHALNVKRGNSVGSVQMAGWSSVVEGSDRTESLVLSSSRMDGVSVVFVFYARSEGARIELLIRQRIDDHVTSQPLEEFGPVTVAAL